MIFSYEDLLKMGLAVLAGGLIGFEREFRDKAAGLRTLIFICLGSTAFTILAAKFGRGTDPTRITANIISGIGFLGAGVILRDRGRVMGLTTAATIWFTAALGMAIGGGYHALAFQLLGVGLVVLWCFPSVEGWISRVREEKNYEIVSALSNDCEPRLQADFERHGLRVIGYQQKKSEGAIHFYWRASGPRKCHQQLIKHLMSSPDIKEFYV